VVVHSIPNQSYLQATIIFRVCVFNIKHAFLLTFLALNLYLSYGFLLHVNILHLQKTATLSNEVTDLNFRLTNSELELSETRQNLLKAQEKESELQSKLEKLQRENEVFCGEAKQADMALKVCFYYF